MKEKSFKVYIVRLLKNVNQGLRMTKSGVEAMDSILRVLADKIVDRSLALTANDDKKTVSDREVLTAVQMVFPRVLSDRMNTFASECLQKYEESEKTRSEQTEVKAQTRESRSGLIFSVSACEKYIRRFGQVGLHVSATSPIVLASVLECFANELLNKTGTVTVESKKITINVRHLFLATANNPELSFVHHLGVVFLEAGVKPETIQTKQHKRIRKVKTDQAPPASSEQKVHRWRPGTKTVMQIRRLQKSGEMLMQHAPFNHLVREIISVYETSSVRLTADFCTTLQSFVENRLVEMMRRANQLAVHSSRETVYGRDVELVCSLSQEPLREYETKSNIPEAALRQMALRAGVQRFGDCSTNVYRKYMVSLLHSYLYDILLCARHHKVQTLNTKILLEALGMRGLYPSITARKRKVGKKQNAAQEQEDGKQEVAALSDVEEEAAN